MRTRAALIVLVVIAFAGLIRFSRETRSVDAVGLFASGMLAGSAIARLISAGRRARA